MKTHESAIMKINQSNLNSLSSQDWMLVIISPYAGGPKSFFGSREDMLALCNDDATTLEWVTPERYEAEKAENEGEWFADWEGEGYYGRYSAAGDYTFIDTDAEQAIYLILSHDTSNNFSWRGTVEEAVRDVERHRLIKDALVTVGVWEE